MSSPAHADPEPGVPCAVIAALRAYARAPGRFDVRQREPAALFADLRRVVQIARAGAGEAGDESAGLAATACGFIGDALFRGDATHYAVLGVTPQATAAQIKDHYRLLVRLTHPDFTASHPMHWPADAPAHLNRAYEVLLTPPLRQRYDDSLVRERVAQRRRSSAAVPRAPWRPQRKVWAASVVAALAVPVLVVSHGWPTARSIEPSRTEAVAPSVAPSHARHSLTITPRDGSMPMPEGSLQLPPSYDPSLRLARLVPASAFGQPWLDPLPAPQVTLASVSAPATPSTRIGFAQANPLLTMLVQQVESGTGERLLVLLDDEAKIPAEAIEAARRYDRLVNGRPVKVTHVQFRERAEAAPGLVVDAHFMIEVEAASAVTTREPFTLQARFQERAGRLVMTSLTHTPERRIGL